MKKTQIAALITWLLLKTALVHALSLPEAKTLYTAGRYAELVEHAMKQELKVASPQEKAEWMILQGLSLSRQQKYAHAIDAFARASKIATVRGEVSFEKGLAEYALERWKPAFESFHAAQLKGYRIGTCAYYMGYISQVQKEYSKAEAYYRSIHGPSAVKGAALFQLAEIGLLQVEQEQNLSRKADIVRSRVLPNYTAAIQEIADDKNPIYIESSAKRVELEDKYFPDPRKNVFSKPWNARISQAFKYDSNLITQADEAPIHVENTGAFLGTFGVAFNGNIGNPKLKLEPRLVSDITLHSRRTMMSVYMNDNFSAGGGGKVSTSYRIFKNETESSLDYFYNHHRRDFKAIHKFTFFSDTHTLVLSQKTSLMSLGDTALRGIFRKSYNYFDAYNTAAWGGGINQILAPSNKYAVLLDAYGEFSKAFVRRNDLNTFRFSGMLAHPDLCYGIAGRGGVAFSLYKPRMQEITRGVEKLFAPMLGITKNWNIFDLNLDYSYNRRYSKNRQNFQYSKNTIALTIGLIL